MKINRLIFTTILTGTMLVINVVTASAQTGAVRQMVHGNTSVANADESTCLNLVFHHEAYTTGKEEYRGPISYLLGKKL